MPKNSHATIIIVRGIPGSGKTHIALELTKALHDSELIMLDPDATDYDSEAYARHVKEQLKQGVDAKLHAYRFLRAQAYNGIANGQTVIWNQPFTDLEIFNKMTANFYKQAEEHGVDVRLLVVEVTLDPAIAWQRIAERKKSGGHGPDEVGFKRFIHDYKTFASDGYETVQVAGSDPVEQSVQKILEKFNQ